MGMHIDRPDAPPADHYLASAWRGGARCRIGLRKLLRLGAGLSL
jgi:hypothetical protein